jgi:hypothetical protein
MVNFSLYYNFFKLFFKELSLNILNLTLQAASHNTSFLDIKCLYFVGPKLHNFLGQQARLNHNFSDFIID